MTKTRVLEIVKKGFLFLLGVVLIIWGYETNRRYNETKQQAEDESSAGQTSTEGDSAEDSSGTM